MARAHKFIKKAIKHPGALTKKAEAAGESPMEFAHEHASDSGTTGKQARLAETLQGFHHKRKASDRYSQKSVRKEA